MYYYFTLQLGTFVIIFLFHTEIEGKGVWIIGGDMLPPLSNYWGDWPPCPPLFLRLSNHSHFSMGKGKLLGEKLLSDKYNLLDFLPASLEDEASEAGSLLKERINSYRNTLKLLCSYKEIKGLRGFEMTDSIRIRGLYVYRSIYSSSNMSTKITKP